MKWLKKKHNGEYEKLNEKRYKLASKKTRTNDENLKFNLISRQLNLINRCDKYTASFIMGINHTRFKKYIMDKK